MSRADTWMPLHVGDYLADTMRLTGAQHGAYLLLLMHYWCSGPLENDDAALANIARTDRKVWSKDVGPAVRRFFTIGEDGLLHQKRCDAEREKAASISEKRRTAAFSSHAQRGTPTPSARADAPQTTGKEDANAVQMHPVCTADAQANEPQRESKQSAPPCARVMTRGTEPSPRKKDSELRSGDEAVAAPRTARDALWQDGLPVLRTITGLGISQARSFLGRMLKTARDDCARTLAVLHEAADLRPVDPQAWLLAAAAANAGKPSKLAYLDAYDGGNVLPFDAPPTIDADWPGAAQ